MSVVVIWEFRFPLEKTDEGTDVARAIWEDMQGFEGYLTHEIVRDTEDSGHLIVISRWSSKEAADEVLELYSDSPNARKAKELVSEPRRRIVGRSLTVED